MNHTYHFGLEGGNKITPAISDQRGQQNESPTISDQRGQKNESHLPFLIGRGNSKKHTYHF